MDIIGSMNVEGNIVLNDNASSEIKNVYLERLTTAAELTLAATLGLPHYSRLIFNVDDGKLKAWDGMNFVSIGGAADVAQAQLNLLQASLGAFITPAGEFNATAFATFANMNASTSTSLLDVLRVIDATFGVVNAPKPLSGLSDVVITAPSAGDTLRFNGTSWVGTELQISDIKDSNVSISDLNQLIGSSEPIESRFVDIETAATTAAADLAQVVSVQQLTSASLGTLEQTTAAIIASSGLAPGGLLTPITGTHYLDGVASIVACLLQLDQKIFDVNTRISNLRLAQIEIPFTSVASIPAVHNLNSQYCSVTCVNQSNVSITPSSIEYTDANNLTVTLATPASGKLVITGTTPAF